MLYSVPEALPKNHFRLLSSAEKNAIMEPIFGRCQVRWHASIKNRQSCRNILPNLTAVAQLTRWSRGKILALNARGPGFDSRTKPFKTFAVLWLCCSFYFFLLIITPLPPPPPVKRHGFFGKNEVSVLTVQGMEPGPP